MILVDTSVWVDHLRKSESELIRKLMAGAVLIHPMIIGELACGNLQHREQRLRDWQSLPQIAELAHSDVLSIIEERKLMGKGLGFIDAHLLCSTLQQEGTSLWTRDKRLAQIADGLSIAFSETVP